MNFKKYLLENPLTEKENTINDLYKALTDAHSLADSLADQAWERGDIDQKKKFRSVRDQIEKIYRSIKT